MNIKQAHGLMGQNWDIKSGPRVFLNENNFFGERNNTSDFHSSSWLGLVIMTQETSLIPFHPCWSFPHHPSYSFSPATLTSCPALFFSTAHICYLVCLHIVCLPPLQGELHEGKDFICPRNSQSSVWPMVRNQAFLKE